MNINLIKALEEKFNYKFTENGAIALCSTGSKVYDMFAFGGAYRNRSNEDCILLFKNALDEDADLAMKCLFYLRDIRGGQGERRFFRVIYRWLAQTPGMYRAAAACNLVRIPEYGRWDDLFCLLDTPLEDAALQLVKDQLTIDMSCEKNGISLLAKWMPSENTSSFETKRKARRVREYLGISAKEYRKMLSILRRKINVLENLMSNGRWDEIEFDKIPSKAGLKYRNAFARRDMIARKYREFITDENTSVNAAALYPYEVVEKVTKHFSYWDCDFEGNNTERAAINKYWANLPDYLNGTDCSMMCVIDTSASMWGRPINVAISLGLYTAERMTGPFAGKYISFSRKPRLIKTEGIDFVDKVERIYRTNLCENTNLTAVFDLILNTYLKYHVKKEDIPKTLVVISDMEIDHMSNWKSRTAVTEMDKVREKWAKYGLEVPRLVYWNVNARNNTILDSGSNISYVSGCSPVIYKSVLTGKQGFELMLDALLSERYKGICA